MLNVTEPSLPIDKITLILLVGRFADWNSKLSAWLPGNSGGTGGGKNTFLNQALNPLMNYLDFVTFPFGGFSC